MAVLTTERNLQSSETYRTNSPVPKLRHWEQQQTRDRRQAPPLPSPIEPVIRMMTGVAGCQAMDGRLDNRAKSSGRTRLCQLASPKTNLLPTHNIQIILFPTFSTISPIRNQIEITVLPGIPIHIRIAPRVTGELLGQIRPIPAPDAIRLRS